MIYKNFIFCILESKQGLRRAASFVKLTALSTDQVCTEVAAAHCSARQASLEWHERNDHRDQGERADGSTADRRRDGPGHFRRRLTGARRYGAWPF